jgi:hypothetical protein
MGMSLIDREGIRIQDSGTCGSVKTIENEDSRQQYRGFNSATGKKTIKEKAEYDREAEEEDSE